MSRLNGVKGPTAKELDEIEKLFNPEELKKEDPFFAINEDSFYSDEFFDMSRTEKGYKRKLSKKNLPDNDAITPKISQSTSIDELGLTVLTYNSLKSANISTVEDIIADIESPNSLLRTLNVKDFNSGLFNELIAVLKKHNIKIKDICAECRSFLSNKDILINDKLCCTCRKKLERISSSKDITMEIFPPEQSSYTNGYSGFHIFINLKNNTSVPIKLQLKECAVFTAGRQFASESNLTDYAFSEDYIFPDCVKTFAKIWKTSSRKIPTLCQGDYLTVSLKCVDDNKVYFFKYVKTNDDWLFDDYYEI